MLILYIHLEFNEIQPQTRDAGVGNETVIQTERVYHNDHSPEWCLKMGVRAIDRKNHPSVGRLFLPSLISWMFAWRFDQSSSLKREETSSTHRVSVNFTGHFSVDILSCYPARLKKTMQYWHDSFEVSLSVGLWIWNFQEITQHFSMWGAHFSDTPYHGTFAAASSQCCWNNNKIKWLD